MRILRDSEWKLVGFKKTGFNGAGPSFLFQHRLYEDVLVLNEAKLIVSGPNLVLFFDAKADKKISVSKRRESEIVKKFPSLLEVLEAPFNVSMWQKEIQTLSA